jgi:hypothetical protein
MDRKLVTLLIAILLVLFQSSCQRSDLYDIMKDSEEAPELKDLIPGNNGIITASNIQPDFIDLVWTKATDVETPQADLEYRVFYSLGANIDTVANVLANGIEITGGWTPDICSITASGLNPDTTYYFNVIVQNQSGLIVSYAMMSARTASLPPIYMFSIDPSTTTGNISGRTGADNLCQAKYASDYSSLGCTEVRGFISIDASDRIADMPMNYGVPDNVPILGPGGTPIANDWADLLDGTILTTMQGAGVLSALGYWTGSNADGTFYASPYNNCTNFTSTSGSGRTGSATATDGTWLSSSTSACVNIGPILCIGW